MLFEYAVEPKMMGSNWEIFRYLIEIEFAEGIDSGGDEDDVGAAGGCVGGDGVALLARRPVGDDPDGVDGLAGPARGHQHGAAIEIPGLPQHLGHRSDDVRRIKRPLRAECVGALQRQ